MADTDMTMDMALVVGIIIMTIFTDIMASLVLANQIMDMVDLPIGNQMEDTIVTEATMEDISIITEVGEVAHLGNLKATECVPKRKSFLKFFPE